MLDSVGCRMCGRIMPGSGTRLGGGLWTLGAGDLRRLTGGGGAASGPEV
jgi:hypothetical protein